MMTFYDFIEYFWAQNLIYVDHFLEFNNIWQVCFFLQNQELIFLTFLNRCYFAILKKINFTESKNPFKLI